MATTAGTTNSRYWVPGRKKKSLGKRLTGKNWDVGSLWATTAVLSAVGSKGATAVIDA